MWNKKILFILLSLLGLFGISFAQVSLRPVYGPERFQPSDMFHAGCENEIDVIFSHTGDKINLLNAILKYSDDIKITKVLFQGDDKNKLSYNIDNGAVTFVKLKGDNDGLDRIVFQVFFEGSNDLDTVRFMFETGSYLVLSNGETIDIHASDTFKFAQVPECNPDTQAPVVNLLYPQISSGKYLGVDSYFKFKIFDEGKGINKSSLDIQLYSKNITGLDTDFIWTGDILTVYPKVWLPVGEDLVLEIKIEDKQVYGKSNLTDKKYKFKVSTGLSFLEEISPMEFREILSLYRQGKSFTNILSGDTTEPTGNIDINKDIAKEDSVDTVVNGFSVFAVLGWIVAGILFLIRLLHFVANKNNE